MQITKIPSSDTYKVANTYVAPEARRQGIATKLNEEGKKLFGSLESSDLKASPAGQAFRKSVLRSDTSQPGIGIAAAKNAPVFYSAVENAVNNASMKAAPAAQWLGTIQNAKGVKPEELQWTGAKRPRNEMQTDTPRASPHHRAAPAGTRSRSGSARQSGDRARTRAASGDTCGRCGAACRPSAARRWETAPAHGAAIGSPCHSISSPVASHSEHNSAPSALIAAVR